MKNKIISAIALLAMAFTASCSKNTPKVNPSIKGDLSNLPAWVLDPNIDDGIGGVGIASPSQGGIKFQLPKAELDAKANIAATIQSEITRISKDAMRLANVNNSDDVEQFFSQATKEVVKELPLSGVKRLNIFRDKDGTLYVHMGLRNEDYSKFLENSERTFEARLAKSNVGRANINKTQEATKSLFEELEKERNKE